MALRKSGLTFGSHDGMVKLDIKSIILEYVTLLVIKYLPHSNELNNMSKNKLTNTMKAAAKINNAPLTHLEALVNLLSILLSSKLSIAERVDER